MLELPFFGADRKDASVTGGQVSSCRRCSISGRTGRSYALIADDIMDTLDFLVKQCDEYVENNATEEQSSDSMVEMCKQIRKYTSRSQSLLNMHRAAGDKEQTIWFDPHSNPFHRHISSTTGSEPQQRNQHDTAEKLVCPRKELQDIAPVQRAGTPCDGALGVPGAAGPQGNSALAAWNSIQVSAANPVQSVDITSGHAGSTASDIAQIAAIFRRRQRGMVDKAISKVMLTSTATTRLPAKCGKSQYSELHGVLYICQERRTAEIVYQGKAYSLPAFESLTDQAKQRKWQRTIKIIPPGECAYIALDTWLNVPLQQHK